MQVYAPGVAQVVGSMSSKDFAIWGGLTGASMAGGYCAGFKNRVTIPMTFAFGVVGGFGGFLLSYQNSWGRLMGYNPPK